MHSTVLNVRLPDEIILGLRTQHKKRDADQNVMLPRVIYGIAESPDECAVDALCRYFY